MDDALAVLLLPARLEDFEHEAQARGLLSIPRVLALEPARWRTPRFLREGAAARQAARIRLPGELRAVVLYHPAQYPLARALLGRHERAELWYVAAEAGALDDEELESFDRLARERAAGLVAAAAPIDDEPLRLRLLDLEVISRRPFVPAARFAGVLATKGPRGRT